MNDHDQKQASPPVIILGVPRSGTTLLRTILDAHPNIACGPETPWLAEHQPATLLGLVRAMCEGEQGYCESFGQPAEVVHRAARGFLDEVLLTYARSRGKGRWAEKTPNTALHLDALHAIVPDAKYVWITRDPLDVAQSTAQTARQRGAVSPVYESRLRLAPRATTAPTELAAVLRWVHWNRRIEEFLGDKDHLHLTYERLVCAPGEEVRRLCAFLEEPCDAAVREAMLAYDTSRHDLPKWEWGSADVAQHGKVVTGRIGTAMSALDEPLRDGLAAVAGLWRPPDRPGPEATRSALPVSDATCQLVGEQAAALLPGRSPADAQRCWEMGEALVRLSASGERDSSKPHLSATMAPVAFALAFAGRPATVTPANEEHRHALAEHARRWRVEDLITLAEHPAPRTQSAGSAPNGDATGLRTVSPASHAVLARLEELKSEPYVGFMARLNGFAHEHGLREFDSWSKIWEYPWLWFHGIEPLPLAGLRVVDMGSELSPMPWWLATMGARVTLIETTRGMEGLWAKLQAKLNVRVDWAFTDDESIPLPDNEAHLVTSLSVIEHQPDKKRAMDEIARVLVPGGVLAMSFDICEQGMGMRFPEWNGRALTMAEFEADLWSHPKFAASRRGGPIAWNTQDIGPYFEWHKTTAEHHTYVTGAAVMRRD